MTHQSKFPIVAIGLSAGGIEPLWEFFSQIPVQSGLAFIVIQHLNRDYISRADKLLAKHTDIPVQWAKEGQVVQPDHVYMLPINQMMTIQEGVLHLQERDEIDRSNWAINLFFHSLARGEKAQAIGIILSGMGTDGTLGAIQIHAQGGEVMVQDPATAQFASMPQSVLMKDHPSESLPPKRLAEALLEYVASLGELENLA